jgi:hypothetical protein
VCADVDGGLGNFLGMLELIWLSRRVELHALRTESGIALIQYQFCKGCVVRNFYDVFA